LSGLTSKESAEKKRLCCFLKIVLRMHGERRGNWYEPIHSSRSKRVQTQTWKRPCAYGIHSL